MTQTLPGENPVKGAIFWPDIRTLQRALVLKGLNQERLAERAGISPRTAALLFNTQKATARTMRLVCQVLEIDMAEVLPEYLREEE